MRAANVEANTITYNSLLSACEKVGTHGYCSPRHHAAASDAV